MNNPYIHADNHLHQIPKRSTKINEGANTKADKSPNGTHQLYATPSVTQYAFQLI